MSESPGELQGLRALDPEALTNIHARYFPEVYRYALARVGDAASAEDLAGEVFVRLLEAVDAGHGPETQLRGWLIGTASHLVADHYREIYRHPTDALPADLPSGDPGPAHHAERAAQMDILRGALDGLTQDQQEVISLRFGSGLSLRETAAALGKNANAIKALQFRALAALRRQLGDRML